MSYASHGSSPFGRQRRRKSSLVYLVVPLVGLFLFCCVCSPILSLFVTTDVERANALWEEGKKQAAVEVYTTVLERAGSSDPVVFKRTIEYYYEQGDLDLVTRFSVLAAEKNVSVSLTPTELRELYTQAQEQYANSELERKAREHAAKQAEEERRIREKQAEEETRARELAKRQAEKQAEEQQKALQTAEERAENERKARELRDTYTGLLSVANVTIVEGVSVRSVGSGWEAIVSVKNSWHFQPYQIRLQQAQTLWESWARIASPKQPDLAYIKIVDLKGNKVGGSRGLGGSTIWVQEK